MIYQQRLHFKYMILKNSRKARRVETMIKPALYWIGNMETLFVPSVELLLWKVSCTKEDES
jgi:hypothetical protein